MSHYSHQPSRNEMNSIYLLLMELGLEARFDDTPAEVCPTCERKFAKPRRKSILKSKDGNRKAQYVIYLAQRMGIRFGYGYQFVASGPYSPDLRDAIGGLCGRLREAEKDVLSSQIKKEFMEKVEILKELVGEASFKELQLYAFIEYLKRQYNDEGMHEFLVGRKYKPKEVDKAIERYNSWSQTLV